MPAPSPQTGHGQSVSALSGPGRVVRSLVVALVGAVVLSMAAPAQASAAETDRTAQHQQTEREQRQLEREARQEQRQAERAARQAQRDADRAERRAERAAERDDLVAERRAEREQRRAERQAERAERQAERAERQAERAARQAARAARQAERQAKRDAEREAHAEADDHRDDDARDERDDEVTTADVQAPSGPDTASNEPVQGLVDLEQCETFVDDKTHVLSRVTASIGADVAHEAGIDGDGIDIAVVDTGVTETGGLRAEVVPGVDLSFDSIDPDRRGRDFHGHGTAMASIAASDGGFGGDGVAPGARIVDVRVGASDGMVDVSQVIAALDWIVENRDTDGRNIRVVSLSYNTDSQQPYEVDPLSRAVENAWHAGIVVVVAGGNDGLDVHRLGNPATNPYVIAVAGADLKENDNGWRVAPWSSAGDGVRNPDVVAPGHRILAGGVTDSRLARENPAATCVADGDTYLRGSGSSQSAAVVAGAAALLLDARPGLSPDQVKHLLMSTADALGLDESRQGQGMIDIDEALAAPSPGAQAVQDHLRATGLGSLEESRGTHHVGSGDDLLQGEETAFGSPWDPAAWVAATEALQAWSEGIDLDGELTGATWSGATWSGATWSGATWSGATWSGATWSGATWSGATWSGATWLAEAWQGASWTGASWT